MKVKLSGSHCLEAKSMIFDIIKKKLGGTRYPESWQQLERMQFNHLIVLDVPFGSQEYIEIETRFTQTMPQAILLKIERI